MEKMIAELQNSGYNVVEENNVVMVLYPGDDYLKEFKKVKKIAAAAGYNRSIGIRKCKGGAG